ncbi:MAG TPA: hypothetical protein VL334_18700 [Anaerolineae bacterium]|nr:hypothetical protein [Anaerolineae bacterium]
MRFFNTAGPTNRQKHYCVPPLTRFNLDDILGMIDRERYPDGYLVIFDRTPGKTWEEKIFQHQERYRTATITVWGM